MLILTRQEGNELVIRTPEGREIVIRVVEAAGRIRLGVTADRDVEVVRKELEQGKR